MRFGKSTFLNLFLLLMVCLSTNLCLGQEVQKQPSERKSEPTIEDVFPTPLLRAIVRKQKELVIYLLREGANPNVKENSKFTETPVLVAADVGDIDILRALLDAGTNIEAKNEIGLTALMIATLRGNIEVVKFLTNKKAHVNARSENESTALMIAARDNRKEIVRWLLIARAEVNATTKRGHTALMGAADDSEIIKVLVESGANLEAVGKRGWTAVCWAKVSKQSKKLEALIKAGAKPNGECIRLS